MKRGSKGSLLVTAEGTAGQGIFKTKQVVLFCPCLGMGQTAGLLLRPRGLPVASSEHTIFFSHVALL